jgi:hypothetical protein
MSQFPERIVILYLLELLHRQFLPHAIFLRHIGTICLFLHFLVADDSHLEAHQVGAAILQYLVGFFSDSELRERRFFSK